MSKYEKKYDYVYDGELEDVEYCDSCGHQAPLAEFGGNPDEESRWLCELCACSYVGNATKYPNQYQDPSLYIAIAQIGNIILDRVTERDKYKPFMEVKE